MNAAAQVASVVGCAGLVAVYLAPSRAARLAGLVAWGTGLGVLGVTLLPDLSRTKLAAAAVGGLVLAAVVALVLRRWPYFLAFATLACIPLRLPVDIGDDKVNLLLPLYGVVAGLAAGARLGAPPRRRPIARARPRRLAARGVRRVERASRWCGRSTSTAGRSSSAPSCSRSGCSRSASPGSRGAAAG